MLKDDSLYQRQCDEEEKEVNGFEKESMVRQSVGKKYRYS